MDLQINKKIRLGIHFRNLRHIEISTMFLPDEKQKKIFVEFLIRLNQICFIFQRNGMRF